MGRMLLVVAANLLAHPSKLVGLLLDAKCLPIHQCHEIRPPSI